MLNHGAEGIVSPITDPNKHKDSNASCSNPFGKDFDDEAKKGKDKHVTLPKGACGDDFGGDIELDENACDENENDLQDLVSGIDEPEEEETKGKEGKKKKKKKKKKKAKSKAYVNRKIQQGIRGFTDIEEMVIVNHKITGYVNNMFMKSMKYQVKKGRAGRTSGRDMTEKRVAARPNFCVVKTEARSCDCLLWMLTLGCCGRGTRYNVIDSVENQAFYFLTPGCGSVSMEVYTACDDLLVGTIEKKKFRVEFEVTDHRGKILFTVKGPAYCMFWQCGKMKFHAKTENPDGKEVVVGMTHNDDSGAYIHFGPQCKKDRQTKLMFLATAFLIETHYYKNKFNENFWCS